MLTSLVAKSSHQSCSSLDSVFCSRIDGNWFPREEGVRASLNNISDATQILPTKTRFGFAKAKVEIQKHLDGSIYIFYKKEELPFKPIIPQEDERYTPSQEEVLLVGV